MNRREWLRNALLSAGALSSSGRALAEQNTPRPPRPSYPPPPRRTDGEPMPNILWVCTDQQRFDTLQGISNDLIHTPNLAKFAQEATTFTNVFVQTPICAPSRGSFLTGRYPHCTGLRANGQRIRPSERLVTRILADYEYTCGLAGKLHLSPCSGGRVEDRIDDGYEIFHWSHDIGDGWLGANEWRTWLQRQGVNLPKFPRELVWGMPIDPKYTQTAWCGEMANDFMRSQRAYGPWLFSCNIYQPHSPFFPSEEYLHHYDPAKMPNPQYKEGELENKSMFQKIDHEGAYAGTDISFTKTSPEQHRQMTAAYYAMIEQADTAFGRMLETLEETGQADNTVVIFMSDHGEMLGDHGIYLKGPYFYDCLTRVPLMIRWPGRYKAGQKVDALVELIDLAPTLLDAAGIPVPSSMQGRSLTPLLTGKEKTHRDSVYTEYLDANFPYPIPPMLTSVRTEKYKLTLCDKPRGGELYDMQHDPGEVNNLWTDPHARDAKEEMMELLASRMIEATDPEPRRHAPW